MGLEKIDNRDIDELKELQPEGWTDIRPYFYYYLGSEFCEALKITQGKNIMAIGTSIRHEESAWLAHIVVHKNFRNNGLGREIASSLIEGLDKAKYKTVYLDATDMGYPVYKKLGFEIETEYIHLDGDYVDNPLTDPETIIPFHEGYRDQILELDRLISGENRLRVLKPHLTTALLYVSDGKLLGAYFPKLFDGLILAVDALAGTELMKLRMRASNSARFPITNQNASNFLLDNGYKQIRTSKRMILGEKRKWCAEGIFNRVSGGLG